MQTQYGQRTPYQTPNRQSNKQGKLTFRKDLPIYIHLFIFVRQWICIFVSLASQCIYLATRIVNWLLHIWILNGLYKGTFFFLGILGLLKGQYLVTVFCWFIYPWIPDFVVFLGNQCYLFATWILNYSEKQDLKYMTRAQ